MVTNTPVSLHLADTDRDAVAAVIEVIRNRWPVERVILFGSKARGDDDSESDIDLLVEFLPLDASNLYRAYFALLNDLRQGLAARVDLVMADAVRNPIVKQAIDASKQQIYAA